MWSLRKRFVLSPNGRYVLIRRTYVSKAAYTYFETKDCKAARIEYVDSNFAWTSQSGYYSIFREHACDAVVVNRAGAGVCLNVSGTSITVVNSNRNNPNSEDWGYRVSATVAPDNFMWRHLIQERGWHSRFQNVSWPTPKPESGYRNFSQKCGVAGCNSDNEHELFLPDLTVLRP
jgi:hypothetical protein